MVRNLAALLLLVCWLGRGGTTRDYFAPHPRLKGGEDCSIEDFPYQVQLQEKSGWNFVYHCAANIITNSWAITVGWCVTGYTKERLRIKSGATSRGGDGNIHHISEIIIHPEYDYSHHQYDVVLIKVTEPFVFSDVVQPIALAETTPAAGTPVLMAAWGSITYSVYPDNPQCANVTTLDDHECRKIYGDYQKDASTFLCAGGADGKVAAHDRDNASGLTNLNKDYLLGIMSWWNKTTATTPAFTNMAKVRNWVMSTINSKEPATCKQCVVNCNCNAGRNPYFRRY